jgi:hypothetical protein
MKKISYYIEQSRKIAGRSVVAVLCCLSSFGCVDYLDVIPDNLATLDNAFVSAEMAEKYLFTCYSYMPSLTDPHSSSLTICDEYWMTYPSIGNYLNSNAFVTIARGNQNVVDPSMNYWDGANNGIPMFVGIRTCNTFMEKIDDVPIEGFETLWSDWGKIYTEKDWWIAEAKFLKAYYHYFLVRLYGPIPLIRQNLSVSASVDEVKVPREPVDDCFKYIVELLDEAIPNLPEEYTRPAQDLGRITRPIAKAFKAKVLVEAASPLFNGNQDYATFINPETGEPFFNQTYANDKWVKAADACREAVEEVEAAGHELYHFFAMPTDKINDSLQVQMNIRGSVSEGNINLNREAIWLDVNHYDNTLHMQMWMLPCLDAAYASSMFGWLNLLPTINIAEMFYTDHGVPINEDIEWASDGRYSDRYKLRTAESVDKYYIKEGEQTAGLNFDREPRYYGNLSFDRCVWFGNGHNDKDNMWVVKMRNGDPIISGGPPTTGFGGRKMTNYQSTCAQAAGAFMTPVTYGWPVIRLADLYLMFAEALNEAYGPSAEAYDYIDRVRARAGLEGVVAAYSKYGVASVKNKHATQDGLRDIIQRERLIELYGEGHRFYDIRRWKRGKEIWHNQTIQGWNFAGREPEIYYRVTTLFTRQFANKDYLFPIRESDLDVNPRLVQNPGWE